jgi:hypothetical protein
MKAKQSPGALALALGIVLSAAAFAAAQGSGFLGDYSALQAGKDATGERVMRYVNPKLNSGAYEAVMIEPTQYYPAPMPSRQVSAETLEEIRNYVDEGLRDRLGAEVKLASQPGPGVLRMRPAITAVASQTPGLKPYQYIPVAFIVSSAKGRGKEAAINIEVELTDSVSGERMGAAVRKGAGAKLASDDAQLRLDDLKPVLDRWIDTGASFVAAQMK